MDRARNRRYDRDYARHYADPLETPPEPMGFWGLSRRSRRWAREEDRWGMGGRAEERARARARERGSERPGRGDPLDRGGWGPPGYGWGSGRRMGAYEPAPGDYGRGEREWWQRHRGGRDTGLEAADEEHGTGAWGPGQAEPGLWGRGAPPRSGRGRRARRASEERDRDYGREYGRDYGRERGRERDAWRRPGPRRPDLRQGEAWREFGPERWTRERRPEDREGFAKEWDRGFYFGREDKGGGTLPSVGRHKWTPGTGPGPGGREYAEEYGPPARAPRRRRWRR